MVFSWLFTALMCSLSTEQREHQMCWFGADLLPSTRFKMNFLIKWSAGGISKLITRSLYFSSWLTLVYLLLALIELVYKPLHVFLFTCAATANFSISPFFISKVFFNPSFQISFCLSYIYLLAILAIDLINVWFLFWWNVIFQVGIQKIFDGVFVVQREYCVVVFEDFVKFIMCP